LFFHCLARSVEDLLVNNFVSMAAGRGSCSWLECGRPAFVIVGLTSFKSQKGMSVLAPPRFIIGPPAVSPSGARIVSGERDARLVFGFCSCLDSPKDLLFLLS